MLEIYDSIQTEPLHDAEHVLMMDHVFEHDHELLYIDAYLKDLF